MGSGGPMSFGLFVIYCSNNCKMVILGGSGLHLNQSSNSLIDIFYHEIKNRMVPEKIQNTPSSALSLTLLCHTDLDAICTLRILVALLKSDSIPYEIIPVAGYADLKQIDASNVTTSPRSLILTLLSP